ncbi:glyoxylase-like metal-dependent hydrolase (beta-lactamase superfamily II) [Cytobacillus eiseniae]|uniref:Glyoxylase-like metal-dependent hydrolase (Beta-lactamase superfamily II) n=1 Tax=Cytobacillus eiseniae TaxID=762947 RepID=A0ABS4RD08_9BACI|nr:MBL fold metallo-hydrolase [Cytobacillus eiseniae]MBP2240781.1 glyoxylase-like metal-dependent hydrolase (beta-lactamase superfamily II) [Cytobacillus eiseniae]
MAEWKNGIAKLVIPTPFPVGDVNVYVVKGEKLTLIDVGPKTETAWEALTLQLKALELTPHDIEQVVLTHHHPDHAGLLDYFAPGLEVYGHRFNQRWLSRTEDFLSSHDEFYYQLFHEFGIPEKYLSLIGLMKKTLRFTCNRSLTGELVEGDTPPGLESWRVIETPGHAQSHIGLFREIDGVYIGGDHLLAHISPNPLLEPPLPGETERPRPQLQYNESLKKLMHLPIQVVYPGHGEDIDQVNELIEKRLARQHERALHVRKWLESESLTVFEICRRLFPTVYEKELSLTLSETVAQLDYLHAIGEIMINKKGQAFLYHI